MRSLGFVAVSLLGLTACGTPPPLRIATFNTSLHRPHAGDLARELEAGSEHARAIAAIVQRVRPDVLLLNEVDRDAGARAAELLRSRYLAVDQGHGDPGIDYPFVFAAEVNTGVRSGHDLDADGRSDGPGDAWGFGEHPGQYGMVLLSRFPIARDRIRTFRMLRWRSMPGNLLPTDFYSPEVAAELRLSSKSHWDVPVVLPDGRTLHLLASHPTPPVFDGQEDRNGRRNHDEIRLWADYLTPARAGWIVDDDGRRGGLPHDEPFVILGDLNCDPSDGDSRDAPVRLLLDHPRVDAFRTPEGAGGTDAAARQLGANAAHRGPAAADTGDFRDDPGPGNLRLDYALPSRRLACTDGAVFWPLPDAPLADLVEITDHRLVWIEVR